MGDFERYAGSSPFCLGMVDFDCCGVKHKFDNQENADDDFQPPVKKGKLKVKRKYCLPPSVLILQLLLMKLSSSQKVLFQRILQEVQIGHTEHLNINIHYQYLSIWKYGHWK